MAHGDLSRAVNYNRKRTYPADQWRMIQTMVGTTPDGDPGPLTARAVMAWQAAHGLDADGKVGPLTLAAIRQARANSKPSTRAHVSTLCLWWDLGPAWSGGDAEAFADELKSMGVDVIGLMADRSEPTDGGMPWWRWRPGAGATFAHVLRSRGIGVGLGPWPRPDPPLPDRLKAAPQPPTTL